MSDHMRAKIEWQSGLRFEAYPQSGHQFTLDSPSRPDHAGPSPMELVLIGVAGCTGMDVASILEKMQQKVRTFSIIISAERNDTHPKYFKALDITYSLTGEGLNRDKVNRAVELSNTNYCSVIASLRPDCKITTTIEIAEA